MRLGEKLLDEIAPIDDNLHLREVERAPLVSFIVINYNYGDYLSKCVESIFQKDYSNFECIIVDNASTDGSAEIIRALAEKHPNLLLIQNDKNYGQIGAARQGYELSSGLFVAFIDADDYILPHYARTHIQAHVTSNGPLAFTSGDMIELVNGTVRFGRVINGFLKETFTSEYKPGFGLPHTYFGAWSAEPPGKLKLRIVHMHTTHWVWAPTSGNMYRREAIALFINNPHISKLKLNLDAYLNFALNALVGSLIIEEPLAVYRVHNRNNFAQSGQLQNLYSFDPLKDHGAFAAFCALEYMTENYEIFDRRTFDQKHLRRAMDTLAQIAAQKSFSSHKLRELSRPWIKRYWQIRLRRVLPHLR